MDIEIGHSSRPFQLIPPCGDGWISLDNGAVQRLMLADGIGHGQHAHQIVRLLEQQLSWLCQRSTELINLADCLINFHQVLKRQGADWQAAVALVDLNRRQKSLSVAIVGNVEVRCIEACSSSAFPGMRGMVGGRLPSQLLISQRRMQNESLIGIFSDGVESRSTVDYLDQLRERRCRRALPMQTESESIIRDFGKLTDDASCALTWISGVSE